MKTQRNILIAFILNLSFAIFEFVSGFVTGSIAIFSDSIHDLGDAISIGTSYYCERKSKKKADVNYSYGYARYSVMGAFITTLILLIGSCIVIKEAIGRIINPVEIKYNEMIVVAIIGVITNFAAAMFTHEGDSLNQKAVNLHMLEDVLGWVVVLIGAIVMKFVDLPIIDPIMSIGVALFILIATIKNLKETVVIFLEKTPGNISINKLKEHILEIEGILDVHHIHVWTLDGSSNFATLHVVTNGDSHLIKNQVKEELKEHGISHTTVEIETSDEECSDKECHIETCSSGCHHHHH